jgi:hypothetical protein
VGDAVPGAIVSRLLTAAVKGTQVRDVRSIELGELGARGNRAFCIVDDRGRMVNGKRLGELHAVVSDYAVETDVLALGFPDGAIVEAPLRYSGTMAMRFFSIDVEARVLDGPWAGALSEFAGRPLRIVAPPTAIDRGRVGAVSVVSRGSLRQLAEVAASAEVDARRFRMLIEVDGVLAHAEDDWLGRRVRIGAALVAMRGNVGRCLVTSRDPETGEVTLPTLDLLGSYRRELDSTEPLPFGIYGEVLEPGPVAIGDPVALADA